MLFDADDLMLIGDAQLRHVKKIGDDVLLGFQFTSVENAVTGSRAIHAISAKVSEYQRIEIQHLRANKAVTDEQPAEDPQVAQVEEAAEAPLEEPG